MSLGDFWCGGVEGVAVVHGSVFGSWCKPYIELKSDSSGVGRSQGGLGSGEDGVGVTAVSRTGAR